MSNSNDDGTSRLEERRVRKLRRRLDDIVSYGRSIVVRLQNETSTSFASDADLHDLVYYRLLCVSEAVRNALLLDAEIANRNPNIPWFAIRAVGNILRHQYGEVDAATIWQTFTRGDVDALITAAQGEIGRLDA